MLFAIVAVVVGLGTFFVFRAVSDGGDAANRSERPADPGPIHVHGLGVNPADGALFIATHTGLYRVGKGERTARRVSENRQDTMGFTVIGPNHFLGSGHPDIRDDLPPLLGLVESRDAGKTWTSKSLLGEADFHVLRATPDRIFGYDASNGRLLASVDGGRRWNQLTVPAPLIDLVSDPEAPRRLVAASERGLHASRDAGETWKRLDAVPGLLAWPRRGELYRAHRVVQVSRDGGASWRTVGRLGGEAAAFLGNPGTRELYAALHDGTVKRSVDGGRTWSIRSAP